MRIEYKISGEITDLVKSTTVYCAEEDKMLWSAIEKGFVVDIDMC